MKELKLIIQPRIIDHLGIKMYQKPVDVVSEFIANSWDADSEIANVIIENDNIKIIDKGSGMSFEECQNYFLTVGRDRRIATGKDHTEKGRPVLGRKGIGKFSGFGVAQKIEIKTISEKDGELTSFELDIEEIIKFDASDESAKPIKVLDYQEPNSERIKDAGTVVTLQGINTSEIDVDIFKEELSRRFLLSQIADDFEITVNGNPLPESFSTELEYVFPRDLSEEDKKKIPDLNEIDDNGWGIESFKEYEMKWRIGFYEDTIETEELRGISIFAKGKLAQKPFFFDMTGGISSQFGLEYMTGQILMDFVDDEVNNLISTERQRINLQTPLGKDIRAWGIERIKLLSAVWKAKRSEKRMQELEDKLGGFKERLDKLPSTERKTVKSVLLKIANFERLGKRRFQDWCNDILTSWEKGRLRELITKFSEVDNLDEEKLIEMLTEADILTALNIAEGIKTKILTVGELKQRVQSGQLENKVRDYIYEHPWIIHPKWEGFQKERSVKKLLEEMGAKHLDEEPFNGRVDLALCSGNQLLIVEFMRPGLEIDLDHLERINLYITDIKNHLKRETGVSYSLETSYVIADSRKDEELVSSKIQQIKENNDIQFMTWNSLIEQAIKQWQEYLELIKERNPEDRRIQDL